MPDFSGLNVESLVEPFFKEYVRGSKYEILSDVDPSSLLTWDRFDLSAKLLFLTGGQIDGGFNESIYKEHIDLFTLGTFAEPGNDAKNTLGKFKSDFLDLYKKIKTTGFDPSISLLPLSRTGSILNGAHRLACAIKTDARVLAVKLDAEPQIYDYKFFAKRGASESFLDACATNFVKSSPNTYIALVWPAAIGHDKDIAQILGRVVYHKDIKLSWNFLRNLIIQIYADEQWLGTPQNNYKGVIGKVDPCFSENSSLRVFAFQADSIEEVLDKKQAIRDLFNLGKNSIHINDTKDQSIELAHLLFNENTLHFIKNGNPTKFRNTNTKIAEFLKYCDINEVSKENLIIDGSMTLALYGLREARDIDYISTENIAEAFNTETISQHDEALVHHRESARSLVDNPKFHFHYKGLKFVSFSQLYQMKRQRGENKDAIDLQMMNSFQDPKSTKFVAAQFKRKLFYWQAKTVTNTIRILKLLGCYKPLRFMYRKMRPVK